MDTGKREVVVSEKYREDLKNIFQYGVETFGYKGSVLFYENIERIVNNLGSEYFMYPECRFLTSKSRMYRNIILEIAMSKFSHQPGMILWRIPSDL